ncbi:sugar phosphate permease [Amycolatopsis lexingtonensis]|uniref:Sugar phosphate permease n=1 Tax=Amycolatopsis lexingtonensis TaxID=218822 RepID=A0ABR9HSP0_9PSEU|nr:MFS transporter [Amycolatopsis lexingtonensis]MBE1493934.1 sugar phosphate permease [Amycolatopsis lexingtonensis]
MGITRSRYRWVILAICWLAFTLIYINRTAWAVVAVDASHSLGLSVAQLGIFATALSIGYVVSNIPGGIVADLIGGRMAAGISLVAAGILTVAFGTVTNVGVGIALQIVIGLVSGADVASFTKLISRWFPPAERGTAFGLYITSTALGSVIANASIPALLAQLHWNGVYYVLGVLTVVVGVVCWTFLRNDPPSPVEPAVEPPAPGERLGLRAMVRNRNLLALAAAGLGMQWATLGFLAWGNSLMVKALGLSAAKAALVMVVVSTTAIGVKPLVGFLSDRLRGTRKAHLMVLSGYFVVILVVFGLVRDYSVMLVLAPFLGLGVYGYTVLTNSTVPQYADPRFVGGAFGFANTAWQLGGVFAPIAVGAVFGATGSLFLALAALAAGPLLGVFLLLFIRADAETPVAGKSRERVHTR